MTTLIYEFDQSEANLYGSPSIRDTKPMLEMLGLEALFVIIETSADHHMCKKVLTADGTVGWVWLSENRYRVAKEQR